MSSDPLPRRLSARRGSGADSNSKPGCLRCPPTSTSQSMPERHIEPHYAVIGGGIAGVCCAQELARLNPDQRIVLISSTDVLKQSKGVMKITNYLEEVSVYERKTDQFQLDHPSVHIITGQVVDLDSTAKQIYLKDGQVVPYKKLCICSGGSPALIATHPNVIGIRDLESAQDLAQRLRSARNVVVVGNGGIALEIIYMLDFCKVHWVIKDAFIGSTFLDASAASFIMPQLSHRLNGDQPSCDQLDRQPVSQSSQAIEDPAMPTAGIASQSDQIKHGSVTGAMGAAIGPEWLLKSGIKHVLPIATEAAERQLKIHYQEEVIAIRTLAGIDRTVASSTFQWYPVGGTFTLKTLHELSTTNDCITEQMVMTEEELVRKHGLCELYALTSKGEVIGCDFIVSGTGVHPALEFLGQEFNRASEDCDAVIVGNDMSTSVCDVYAAGDCCSYVPDQTSSLSLWFQMKLWSQARFMGTYAAQCMCGLQDELGGSFFFELFSHITRVFDVKVVLLGCFNGRGLGSEAEALVQHFDIARPSQGLQRSSCSNRELEVWMRVTPGVEYIKLVVYHSKLIGAMLIGDTDLEETMENLILNRVDLGHIGINLLDPDIDIEDYFD